MTSYLALVVVLAVTVLTVIVFPICWAISTAHSDASSRESPATRRSAAPQPHRAPGAALARPAVVVARAIAPYRQIHSGG